MSVALSAVGWVTRWGSGAAKIYKNHPKKQHTNSAINYRIGFLHPLPPLKKKKVLWGEYSPSVCTKIKIDVIASKLIGLSNTWFKQQVLEFTVDF